MSFLAAPGGDRLRWLWSTRLWLLAALLGAVTVYSGASAIHDVDQRRLAIGLIAQSTAMHLSVLASSRLERLALEAFAPAGPLVDAPPAPAAARAIVERLARRQRDGVACACRDVLPAAAFFHLDAGSRRLELAAVDSATAAALEADTSVLGGIARTEANGPRGTSNAASRLIIDPRLDDRGVVALVQRDERGDPVAVYGAVVETRATLGKLFAASGPHSHMDSAGINRLDSLSLQISTAFRALWRAASDCPVAHCAMDASIRSTASNSSARPAASLTAVSKCARPFSQSPVAQSRPPAVSSRNDSTSLAESSVSAPAPFVI